MRATREPIRMSAEDQAKVERILARAYSGIHHVEGWEKRSGWGDGMCVTVPSGISTFDFDTLTRLVVAAHDECVRLAISPGGPHRLRLEFHVRKRDGVRAWERHPTMEEALLGSARCVPQAKESEA